MRVRSWMTSEVVTVTPETSVSRADKLMKNHSIGCLPVVDSQMNVVGIVSDSDIKAALPSAATSLDVHEVQYLLSELKVKEIMTIKPVCIGPDDSVESVAMLMEENDFGSMPVTDDDKIVGIITDNDIFKMFISITGARRGGLQLAFELTDPNLRVRDIFEELVKYGARLISVLSHYENDDTVRKFFVRIRPMDSQAKQDELLEVLKKQYSLQYWI